MRFQSARVVSSQPWRLLVHTQRKTMLFISSRRVRLTASVVSPQTVFICSIGVLAAASVPPGAETWNSILDLTHANVHESLKSTPAVQFTLSTCMIALHLCLFPFGATVSTPIPMPTCFGHHCPCRHRHAARLANTREPNCADASTATNTLFLTCDSSVMPSVHDV